MAEKSNSPYSLPSVMAFVSENFGLIVIAVAVFVFGFVSGSMWTENRTLKAGGGTQLAAQDQLPPAPALPLSDADWDEVQTEPVFVLGDADAPITMVEFTDYQCPFCGRHFTDTHAALVEKYVDSGQMKIVYKDQALSFHPNANSAAQAVRCAAESDGAEAMHDELFKNQDAWVNLSGEAVLDKYSELASDAGLSGDSIASCVESEKYKADVDADAVLGNRVGAGGTPTFFIEKQPLVGAQPLSAFEAVIDPLL